MVHVVFGPETWPYISEQLMVQRQLQTESRLHSLRLFEDWRCPSAEFRDNWYHR